MEQENRTPLPAGLYLALIAVIWLAVTVLGTSLIALVGAPPQAAALRALLAQAPPALIAIWASTLILATGALWARGRHPRMCAALAALFLAAYAILAPMIYQARPLGFWVACGALALIAVGALQLARVVKR
ncbi:hypothetical protein [Luteibacter sp. 22Crub2.1]|uniref:hypothetical protein n=1 Tax=Luteibacter sp. 22Crub2.1 TaxID=1283288 RepID=UPI0009A71957|nr:hypothetical protein [Luteibacter sp. 22Crub2.1]SKB37519.1 hypothetical protein SAMN05660880_00771 [Luteibacter sp. 22Crub2.1]